MTHGMLHNSNTHLRAPSIHPSIHPVTYRHQPGQPPGNARPRQRAPRAPAPSPRLVPSARPFRPKPAPGQPAGSAKASPAARPVLLRPPLALCPLSAPCARSQPLVSPRETPALVVRPVLPRPASPCALERPSARSQPWSAPGKRQPSSCVLCSCALPLPCALECPFRPKPALVSPRETPALVLRPVLLRPPLALCP